MSNEIRLKINLNSNLIVSNNKFWYFLDKNKFVCVEQVQTDFLKRFFADNFTSYFIKFSIDGFELPYLESTNVFRDLDIVNVDLVVKKRKIESSEAQTKKVHLDWDKEEKAESIIKPFEACLIGTSMIKHIDTNKLFANRKCFFKSISGGQIKDVLEFIKKREGFFDNCKFIVLTCGSNDCDSYKEIKININDMLELAEYVSKMYPKAKLVINQLIPRLKTKFIHLEDFEKKRVLFNNFLNDTVSLMIPNCVIVKHPAFEVKSELESFLLDGVHMSPLRGVPIYIEEIKNNLKGLDF